MRTDEAVISHYGYLPVQAPRAQTQANEPSDEDGYGSAESQRAMITYGAHIIQPRVNGRLSVIESTSLV